MADKANGMLASDEVLRMLRQIEAHLAALRNGAHGAESQWLTIAQTADELQVSRDTVERLIAAGRLRAAEVGTSAGRGTRRRYRVRRDWIAALLEASRRPSQIPIRERRRRPALRSRVDFIG